MAEAAIPTGVPICVRTQRVPSLVPAAVATGRAPATVYRSPAFIAVPSSVPLTAGTTRMTCMKPSVTNNAPVGPMARPRGSFSSAVGPLAGSPSARYGP